MVVDWQKLLAIAVGQIGSLAKQTPPIPLPEWTLGGGTALMIWLEHRSSRDIDIFLDDPQYLTQLSPRLQEPVIEQPLAYQESANFLKIDYAEGEIDFIIAGHQTDNPFVRCTIAGIDLDLETPVEIAVKKLVFRGSHIAPRDIFDIAVVEQRYGDILYKELSKQPAVKTESVTTTIISPTATFVCGLFKLPPHPLPIKFFNTISKIYNSV